MRSARPKVLHPLAGKALLDHVLDAAAGIAPAHIRVVVGAGSEQVKAAFAGRPVDWAVQAEQLGTAHAVQMALPGLDDDATALMRYGAVPRARAAALAQLVAAAKQDALPMSTIERAEPTGDGRSPRATDGRVTSGV